MGELQRVYESRSPVTVITVIKRLCPVLRINLPTDCIDYCYTIQEGR